MVDFYLMEWINLVRLVEIFFSDFYYKLEMYLYVEVEVY